MIFIALIDWAAIDRHLAPIYASAKGEQAWPPLSLFKALLLAVWYDLSDVKLAEALDDRASFRRFCGFAADEPTPERTAFVRFRRELLARDLDRVLFAAVTDQLDRHGVVVKTGTLVDATLIASASVKTDDEARWAGHRRKKPVHGYKAHVATDGAGGLVRSVEITTANVHDGIMLDGGAAVRSWRSLRRQRLCGRPVHEGDPGPRRGTPRGLHVHLGRPCGPRAARGLERTRFEPCAAGSRRCSGPGSARMACVGCAGSGSPKPGCKCASQRSPTTCGARRRS